MDQETQKQSFLKSFDLYSNAIYRFCVVKTSDTELAEDLTQETFTRYWQALRDKKDMQNTRAFLYAIAQNLIIDWYRKKKSLSLDTLMQQHEPRETRELSAQVHAEYAEARSVIEQLPEEQQTVLMLRYVEGLGPKEIAQMLGVSANVVSVRIDRALKKARTLLDPGRSAKKHGQET